jgi:hypothetical protein
MLSEANAPLVCKVAAADVVTVPEVFEAAVAVPKPVDTEPGEVEPAADEPLDPDAAAAEVVVLPAAAVAVDETAAWVEEEPESEEPESSLWARTPPWTWPGVVDLDVFPACAMYVVRESPDAGGLMTPTIPFLQCEPWLQ